jgi:hypothetical protein
MTKTIIGLAISIIRNGELQNGDMLFISDAALPTLSLAAIYYIFGEAPHTALWVLGLFSAFICVGTYIPREKCF